MELKLSSTQVEVGVELELSLAKRDAALAANECRFVKVSKKVSLLSTQVCKSEYETQMYSEEICFS